MAAISFIYKTNGTKMKRSLAWLFILFVVAAIVALVLYKAGKRVHLPTETELPVQKESAVTNYSLTNRQTRSQHFASNQIIQKASQAATSEIELLRNSLESKNAPISFYGRVIDQDGNGLADVHVSMDVRQWHFNGHWGNTFPEFERITDSRGNFSVENTAGDYLSINSVVKNGYRLSPKAPNSFGYGSVPNPIHPDPQNPVIIKMWELGESANLVSHRTLFGFQPDGRIYTLDLLADKKMESGNANGDLRVQFKRQSVLKPKEEYPWTLELSAVNGGLIETTDEFEYLAPGNGYLPQVLFQTNAIFPKAMPDITKDYYFTSRNGQVYGVVSLQIFSDYNGQSAILVNSRANPNGSRNLQP